MDKHFGYSCDNRIYRNVNLNNQKTLLLIVRDVRERYLSLLNFHRN